VGFDDAFFTFYCKNSNYKLNRSIRFNNEDEVPFEKIKLDFLDLLDYLKTNDRENFEKFIIAKQEDCILTTKDGDLF